MKMSASGKIGVAERVADRIMVRVCLESQTGQVDVWESPKVQLNRGRISDERRQLLFARKELTAMISAAIERCAGIDVHKKLLSRVRNGRTLGRRAAHREAAVRHDRSGTE
jgi:hypothetical protein